MITYWDDEVTLISSKCFIKKFVCAPKIKRNVDRKLSVVPHNTSWPERKDAQVYACVLIYTNIKYSHIHHASSSVIQLCIYQLQIFSNTVFHLYAYHLSSMYQLTWHSSVYINWFNKMRAELSLLYKNWCFHMWVNT